jgi:hypothetical protein
LNAKGRYKFLTIADEFPAGLPANGRLVAEVYDQLQTFEAPFKLENISLLGASLSAGK